MKKAVVMFLLLSLLVMSNAVYAVDILLVMITFFTFLRQVRYTEKDVKFWLPVTE